MANKLRRLPTVCWPVIIGALLTLAGAAENDEKKTAVEPIRPESQSLEVHHPSRNRVRLSGFTIGSSYRRFSGPFYGYYPYGYAPYLWAYYPSPLAPFHDFYSPFYYPTSFSALAQPQGGGEIKLQTNIRAAEVHINGAYAGTSEVLRRFWLEPGAYDLEVKAEDRKPFKRRIYVLSGKTLKITATLESEKKEGKDE